MKVDFTGGGEVDGSREEGDVSRLFSSVTGTSLLAESLKQMAQIRFTLTRDAILLQMVMLEVGYLDRMPNSVSKMVHSTFIPRYTHTHT